MNATINNIARVIIATGLLGGLGACGDDGNDEPARPLVQSSSATEAQCPNGGTRVEVGLDDNDNGTLEPSEVETTELFCDGAPGQTGDPGPAGGVPLVVSTSEPSGANCDNGGDRIQVGVDDNGNGTLDEAEVDSTTYICVGATGEDAPILLTQTSSATDGCPNGGTRVQTGIDVDDNGALDQAEVTEDVVVCDGEDGDRLLITVDAEPAGANCLVGGRRVRSGVDANADGLLSDTETRSEDYLCDPVRNLISSTTLAAGHETCTAGGERIDVGLDQNANGVLEAEEVVTTSFICTGETAQVTLVRRQSEAPGANCANGGSRLTAGPDLNGNNILDAVEVETTTYVCNGSPGINGTTGSAVRLASEPAGPNCPRGGRRIESGIDANANGVLDNGEVSSTSYACNGRASVALVDIVAEPAGANCPTGGQLVRSGSDLDNDGVLDAAEVTTETYVCTSVAQVPIDFVTDTLPNALQRSAYATFVEGIGGVGGGYQWALVGGSLPPGLELEPTGTPQTRIVGTPTAVGAYNFTIELRDFFDNVVTQAFSLEVEQILEVTRFELPRLASGVPYSATLTAAGGVAPRTWSVVSGTLPAGLSLSTGGVISGTPTTSDGEVFFVEVEDAVGATVRAGLTIKGEQRFGAYCGDFLVSSQDDLSVFELNGTTVTSTGTVIAGAAVEVDCFEGIEFSPKRDFLAFQTEDSSLVGELIVADLSSYPVVTTYTVNGPLDTDEDVENFAFSPTGDFIAFIADEAGSLINELYVVDLRTLPPGPPVKVNQPVVTSGDVTTYGWVPNSNKLVYRSDEIVDEEYNLYFYDAAAAGPRVQMNASPTAGGDVNTNFVFSPDGARVAFTGDLFVDNQVRLFLVDVSGAVPGPPIEYSDTFDPDGDVTTGTTDVAFSPNGRWLMFQGDPDNLGEKVYVRDVLTNGPRTLVSQDNANTSLFVSSTVWSPDGRRIAILGDLETDNDFELFIADTEAPGAPIRVNPVLPTSSDVNSISSTQFGWDPNGRYLVYNVDATTAAFDEFWVTFLADSANPVPVFINGFADDDSDTVRVADDGGSMIFTLEFNGTTDVEILRVPINPTARTIGSQTVINDPLGLNQDVLTGFLLVDGGGGVFYRGDTAVDNETDGVIKSVAGGTIGARQRVNPALGNTLLAVTSIRIQKE